MNEPLPRMPYWKRIAFALGGSQAGAWFFLNVATPIDRVLLRLSGGRLSTTLGTLPTVMLTTTGAKSGQSRTVPLVYLPDGDRVVLIASRGGDPRHTNWYHNLRAKPEAALSIDGSSQQYRCYEATGAERETLWAKAVALYPGYAVYQRRCGSRQIPVMVFTRQR